MTDLIACCGNDKGLKHLELLIENHEWDKVIVICSEKVNINCKKKIDFLLIDSKKPLSDLSAELKKKIQSRVNDFEVGVSLFSGTGKEHMALTSALLQLGLAVRFVAVTPEGVKEI